MTPPKRFIWQILNFSIENRNKYAILQWPFGRHYYLSSIFFKVELDAGRDIYPSPKFHWHSKHLCLAMIQINVDTPRWVTFPQPTTWSFWNLYSIHLVMPTPFRVLESSSFRTGMETKKKIHLTLQHFPEWHVPLPLIFPFSRTSHGVIIRYKKAEKCGP